MVATVRNLTSASATSEYFRNEGGYYLEEGEGSEELKAKREEHREASARTAGTRRRRARSRTREVVAVGKDGNRCRIIKKKSA